MHLGVIPDGNRRYARENGIEKKEAYREAKEVILDAFEDLDELPVEVDEVTFYLLSEENLKRAKEERETLFELLREHIEETAREFNGNGFSFNWASTRPDAIPAELREKLEQLEEEYRGGQKQLNALISYDGRSDIIKAAQKVQNNGGDVTRDSLREHLEIETDIDYVIRTGDNPTREAISGFPIWNSSYAEYYHLQEHFPEVTTQDIIDALEHYKKLRKKRGK